jgi:hypothetical protein
MPIIDVDLMVFNNEEKVMSNAVLVPVRHDNVSFKYLGENFTGEVRRVEEKPKGLLMVVKVGEGQYRSCYLEKCEGLTIHLSQPN